MSASNSSSPLPPLLPPPPPLISADEIQGIQKKAMGVSQTLVNCHNIELAYQPNAFILPLDHTGSQLTHRPPPKSLTHTPTPILPTSHPRC